MFSFLTYLDNRANSREIAYHDGGALITSAGRFSPLEQFRAGARFRKYVERHILMSTPAEYRQYAAECLQAIRMAILPEVRGVLLLMAQRWNELADRAERHADLRAPDQIPDK
jgi:hypothetical protein